MPLTKRQRKMLRELSAKAYEEELRRALLPLSEVFERWRAGEVGSRELSEQIHEFHQGPARKLWSRYDTRNFEINVAHAIVSGILDRSEVPADVLASLGNAISFLAEHEEE